MKLKLDANGSVVVRGGFPVYVSDDGEEFVLDAKLAAEMIRARGGESRGPTAPTSAPNFDEERSLLLARVEAARERADVATNAYFAMQSKLKRMAEAMAVLADDCTKEWHRAIAAREEAPQPPLGTVAIWESAKANYDAAFKAAQAGDAQALRDLPGLADALGDAAWHGNRPTASSEPEPETSDFAKLIDAICEKANQTRGKGPSDLAFALRALDASGARGWSRSVGYCYHAWSIFRRIPAMNGHPETSRAIRIPYPEVSGPQSMLVAQIWRARRILKADVQQMLAERASPPIAKLPPIDASAQLIRLIRGEITWQAVGESWHDVFAGDVEFLTSDGWTFVLFNDCDGFDYVSSVTAPDGRRHEYGGHFNGDFLGLEACEALKRLAEDAPVIARP